MAVQKSVVQAVVGKRKSISSSIDLGNLTRRQGLKRQKSGKTPPLKVSKSQDVAIDLDDPAVNLMPVQASPSIVQFENTTPPAAKVPHRVHPSVLAKRPPNLVLDKDYAWKTFKGIISDKEVNACYNISVKDFEHFAIHDFFKVCSFLIILILFF